MRSKVLSAFLALAILLIGSPVRSATSLADLEIHKSVARVVFELPKTDGKPQGRLIATAWAVDERHLITAAHVCSSVQQTAVTFRVPDRLRVEVIDDEDDIRKLTSTIRVMDTVHDVCALWAPGHGLKPLKVHTDWSKVRRLQNIRVVGAPLGEYPAAKDCYISSKNGIDQKSRMIVNRLVTSCEILPGYSGGPILDEDGVVVGVVSGGFFAFIPILPSFMMYGATAPQLNSFLARLR